MTEDKNMGVRDQRKEEKVIKSYGDKNMEPTCYKIRARVLFSKCQNRPFFSRCCSCSIHRVALSLDRSRLSSIKVSAAARAHICVLQRQP
jgi:hypothetical protein